MSKSLLIIDDAISIHRLIQPLAELDQLVLHSAYHGESGLTAAENLQPDLILLDIEMPGIDGFEVCQRLKAGRETKSIPIIFMSAGAGFGNTWKVRDVGAMDFIAKPFKLPHLRERLNCALNQRSSPAYTKANLS